MIRRMSARAAAACAIGLLAVAIAVAGGQKSGGEAAGTSPTNPAPAVAASPTYIIHPDDVLDVSVWKQPELSFRGLPVRPDGKISLPLVNDIEAAGLTAMQLSAAITQKLKKFMVDPQVTVTVAAVNSQKYYMLGEVPRPGVFPLLPGMTALQAISAAGGFTEFANSKKIYILRTVNGAQVKLPFNYKAVLSGKDLQENVRLKPNDTIVVP
ncbi:MAG: polysaccharide biosynthesis/export family protein [Terriglobia bacterium]